MQFWLFFVKKNSLGEFIGVTRPQPNLGELQPDIKNTDVANHLELLPNTLGEHQPDKNLGEHQPNK